MMEHSEPGSGGKGGVRLWIGLTEPGRRKPNIHFTSRALSTIDDADLGRTVRHLPCKCSTNYLLRLHQSRMLFTLRPLHFQNHPPLRRGFQQSWPP